VDQKMLQDNFLVFNKFFRFLFSIFTIF